MIISIQELLGLYQDREYRYYIWIGTIRTISGLEKKTILSGYRLSGLYINKNDQDYIQKEIIGIIFGER